MCSGSMVSSCGGSMLHHCSACTLARSLLWVSTASPQGAQGGWIRRCSGPQTQTRMTSGCGHVTVHFHASCACLSAYGLCVSGVCWKENVCAKKRLIRLKLLLTLYFDLNVYKKFWTCLDIAYVCSVEKKLPEGYSTGCLALCFKFCMQRH